MRLSGLLFVLSAFAVSLHAQQAACAATPEAAAAATLSINHAGLGMTGRGYRVQDVQVDPITRRVWMRVRPCDNDAAPALLVPVLAVAGQVLPSPMSIPAQVRAPLPAATQPLILLHAGDAVRVVWMTQSVHFNVEGKALQQAAEGDTLAVALRGNSDEPGRRILGTLRANYTVEMQP